MIARIGKSSSASPARGVSAATLPVALVAAALAACSGTIDEEPGYVYGEGLPAVIPADGNLGDGISGSGSGDPRINQRLWRLTPTQLNEEVARLFGQGAPQFSVPEPASESGITNIAANGVVDLGNAAPFSDGARAIGDWVAAQREGSTRCASYGDGSCIDSMLAWLVRGAFRRPVSPEEVAELRTLFTDLQTSYDYDYAISGVVRSVLLSPDFLYRTELGDGSGVMTPYEIANLLAFAITDRSPDGVLYDAAERGELRMPEQREAQARRLMGASHRAWQRFFWEWLSLETLESQGAEVGLDPLLVTQMEEEFRAFVSDVIVTQRGNLRQLLSASYTFAQPQLAAHYGAAHPGSGLARIELDPAQRGGLLTQGAWLVSHGKDGKDNVVRRGMNLFKQGMCNNALAPPEGLDVNAALLDLVGPDATVRETVDARGGSPTCGACHQKADPMGIVFESYASDGRFQTVYPNGQPVDTAIQLESGAMFTSAPAFSATLVDDPLFQACFVRRVVHYVAGIDIGAGSSVAWIEEAQAALVSNNMSLEELLVAVVRHPAFVERPTETETMP